MIHVARVLHHSVRCRAGRDGRHMPGLRAKAVLTVWTAAVERLVVTVRAPKHKHHIINIITTLDVCG